MPILPTARWRGPEASFAAALAALIATAVPAQSQVLPNPLRPADPPCVLDKCLQPGGARAPAPPAAPSDGATGDQTSGGGAPTRVGTSVAPGSFDFYVLALSWSPGFCLTTGAERNYRQCEPGSRLGFVVHGLWPQNQRGYPSDCPTTIPNPPRMALQQTQGLYPDEGLARHEWRMHGTCTGKSPSDYFADVKRARASISIPEAFQAPDAAATVQPSDIVRSFATSNPGLRADTMAVVCRSGELQEVRICLAKDLRGFVPCPEVARATCRRPVDVPPAL